MLNHVSGPDLDDLAVAALDNLGEGQCTAGVCPGRECDGIDPMLMQHRCPTDGEDDDITDCDEEPRSQGEAHSLQELLLLLRVSFTLLLRCRNRHTKTS